MQHPTLAGADPGQDWKRTRFLLAHPLNFVPLFRGRDALQHRPERLLVCFSIFLPFFDVSRSLEGSGIGLRFVHSFTRQFQHPIILYGRLFPSLFITALRLL